MKKYYNFLLMALFSLFVLGACSSGGDDIPEPAPKPDPDKVTLNTSSITAEAENGSATLTLTANKAWTASSNQAWCKIDKTSGTAGTVTLNLTLEANPEEKERTATITVKAGTATATATVKQAPKEKTEEGGDDSGEEGKNGSSVEDMENKKW